MMEADELRCQGIAFAGHLVSHRFSVRDTVLATMSSNPVHRSVTLQLFDRGTRCCKDHFLLLERFHLSLVCPRIRFCAVKRFDPGIFFIQLLLPGVKKNPRTSAREQAPRQ